MNAHAAVKQIPVPITAIAPPFSLTLDDPAIRRDIERIRSLRRSNLGANVDAAIAIGETLDRIKNQLKRGLWTRLLRDELKLGAGTAHKNILLFRFERANPHTVRQFKHLGANKLSYVAALRPEVREKLLDTAPHRLMGARARSVEQMNSHEFITYLRGLDPNLRTKSPRLQHLMRVAIQAAERLASSLAAIKKRNYESSPLYAELEEAMLLVQKVVKD